MMTDQPSLPTGQQLRSDMPRFGMTSFAGRFPRCVDRIELDISGDVECPQNIGKELLSLSRVTQVSDFHCVTTWSVRSLTWGGYRFRDVYEQLIVPRAAPANGAEFVILGAQDGYQTSLPLIDLLNDDVLLADELNGRPLSIAHGAPIRLVAPGHYGYKSAKHLSFIKLCCKEFNFRPWYLRWMVHQRGRVALEERGRGLPGWMFRYLFRPLIPYTERLCARKLIEFENTDDAG